jgi:hypothetical protein
MMIEGADGALETSTALTTYLIVGMVKTGIATRDQAAILLSEIADGLGKLDKDMPDDLRRTAEGADVLRRTRGMIMVVRGRATAIAEGAPL